MPTGKFCDAGGLLGAGVVDGVEDVGLVVLDGVVDVPEGELGGAETVLGGADTVDGGALIVPVPAAGGTEVLAGGVVFTPAVSPEPERGLLEGSGVGALTTEPEELPELVLAGIVSDVFLGLFVDVKTPGSSAGT